jgi:hypothetical protein
MYVNKIALLLSAGILLSACTSDSMKSPSSVDANESAAGETVTYTAKAKIPPASELEKRDPKELEFEKKCLAQGRSFKVLIDFGDPSKGEVTKRDYSCSDSK